MKNESMPHGIYEKGKSKGTIFQAKEIKKEIKTLCFCTGRAQAKVKNRKTSEPLNTEQK